MRARSDAAFTVETGTTHVVRRGSVHSRSCGPAIVGTLVTTTPGSFNRSSFNETAHVEGWMNEVNRGGCVSRTDVKAPVSPASRGATLPPGPRSSVDRAAVYETAAPWCVA